SSTAPPAHTTSTLSLHDALPIFAKDIHVLLVLETDGMQDSEYRRPRFPLAWARSEGKGRVYFNAMGHREDVWTSERFQEMLAGADRKSTRLNSSHGSISYAVFCL